jgi:hypothetical protein
MNASEIPLYQIVMLVGGSILFLLAAGLLVYCIVKKRPTKPVLVMLPLAILMIGFPSIKHFKGPGFEFETAFNTVETSVRALEDDPTNGQARSDLEAALSKIETQVDVETASAATAETIARGHEALGQSERAFDWATAAVAKAPQAQSARVVLERVRVSRALPTDASQPLTPAARSNLTSAARELSRSTDLSPITRFTLARAQLALGQTNAAETNLNLAVRANTNLLKMDPRMTRMLIPPPR